MKSRPRRDAIGVGGEFADSPVATSKFRFLSTPYFIDGRARAPAMVSAIPPAISTALMMGDTRSL